MYIPADSSYARRLASCEMASAKPFECGRRRQDGLDCRRPGCIITIVVTITTITIIYMFVLYIIIICMLLLMSVPVFPLRDL